MYIFYTYIMYTLYSIILGKHDIRNNIMRTFTYQHLLKYIIYYYIIQ